MTTNVNKNLSSNEYQSSNAIQRAGRGIKSRRI